MPSGPVSGRSLSPTVFAGFHDAYLAVLDHVGRHAEYRNAPRGNPTRECLNVSFQLSNPLARLPFLPARRTDVVFNLAETLWFLSGRNDVNMITYYEPHMRSLSANGSTIDGTAYGTRLFRPVSGRNGRSAFDATVDLIRHAPDTKRAVMPIFTAQEVGERMHPDVSGALAFQLFQRDGALHAVCYARANDVMDDLAAAVFSFTFVQELAARLLTLELGTYTHHAGSMHIQDVEHSRAERILSHAESSTSPVSFPNLRMPRDTTMGAVRELCIQEQLLRGNQIRHTPESIEELDLDRYWQQLVALLEAYRQIRYAPDGAAVDFEILDFLDPAHRWLLARKWPDRVPQDLPVTARSHHEPA